MALWDSPQFFHTFEAYVGFDLVAQKPGPGHLENFPVDIFQMIFLRSAMLAAGVKEDLVHKKFLGNDGWLVTPLQSSVIAGKLRTWLGGRNLVIDLIERNERARQVNSAVLLVFEQLGDHQQRDMAKHYKRAKSLPLRLNRVSRKVIRKFAEFCDNSGGFRVQ